MTTKHRPRSEAKRIGWIKAGLIAGSLIGSMVGMQMLIGQEAEQPQQARAGAEIAVSPNVIQPNVVQMVPVTRSRSS